MASTRDWTPRWGVWATCGKWHTQFLTESGASEDSLDVWLETIVHRVFNLGNFPDLFWGLCVSLTTPHHTHNVERHIWDKVICESESIEIFSVGYTGAAPGPQ